MMETDFRLQKVNTKPFDSVVKMTGFFFVVKCPAADAMDAPQP
jgi:hypothetical protein